MARVRKQKRQQELVFRTWGGKRKGAGRKQVNERKSEPHRVRPEVQANQIVHVALRVAPELRRLRRRDAYKAIRKALLVVLVRTDFRIVHMSIQANHVHLLIEAENKRALARGMAAFQISAARRLNQAECDSGGRPRRGSAFPDRYHPEIVSAPTHARHTLSYVLNNWRRHKEDRAPYARAWAVDPYSSAASFTGWAETAQLTTREAMLGPRHSLYDDLEPLPVCQPQTWLLREGWKLGGAISAFEVPGKR